MCHRGDNTVAPPIVIIQVEGEMGKMEMGEGDRGIEGGGGVLIMSLPEWMGRGEDEEGQQVGIERIGEDLQVRIEGDPRAGRGIIGL